MCGIRVRRLNLLPCAAHFYRSLCKILEEDTREWKIKEFHNNPQKMVLVLNPAAASEAISLHKACHHAIYVDRSFNAAHYLQSEDRIHRLGITENEAPIIEILECTGTIDELIDMRLRLKVKTMA